MKSAALLAVLGSVFPVRSAVSVCGSLSSQAFPPDWIDALSGNAGKAAAGERCLELGVIETDLTALMKALNHAMRDRPPGVDGFRCEDLRNRLGAMRRTEFASGDVVRVDGWILSRSEARSYGLIALAHADPGCGPTSLQRDA